MTDKKIVIKGENGLKKFLFDNYLTQIKNYLGDEKKAMKFLSAVVSDVQRNPTLLKCEPVSLVNSYMIMAGCGFMPSGVSGEAYVLPYNNSKKVGNAWEKVMEAQFQMGYQGLVTLFYKAGVTKITSGIVYEKDKIKLVNDTVEHEVNPTLSKEKRGKAVGAYVIVTFKGQENAKYMNGEDILKHASKFSKSYDAKGKYSPWNPENDPELTMWMKTVLKQHSKLLPKNETINTAIAADNRDSVISDRIKEANVEGLTMGEHLLDPSDETQYDNEDSQEEKTQDGKEAKKPSNNKKG